MPQIAILWPTLALVLVIFTVWFTLFRQRFEHMRANPPTASDFSDRDAAARYFRPVEMPAANLTNLFEMPVLYFALVPLLLVTHQAGAAQVTLAWIYAGLRAAHSFAHIATNRVPARFVIYLLSCAVLFAMWIGFCIDLAAAARALPRVQP